MYSIEEFDSAKIKVLKYILYKKRTEHEVRAKFNKTYDNEILNDAISYLKEAGYINDMDYIDRAVNEFIALKILSIKELKYKLQLKGLSRDSIEQYINMHYNELIEYEKASAERLIEKKKNSMDEIALNNYLRSKGYNVGATISRPHDMQD